MHTCQSAMNDVIKINKILHGRELNGIVLKLQRLLLHNKLYCVGQHSVLPNACSNVVVYKQSFY